MPTSSSVTQVVTDGVTPESRSDEHAPSPAGDQPIQVDESSSACCRAAPCPAVPVATDADATGAVPPDVGREGAFADLPPLRPIYPAHEQDPPRALHGAPPEVAPGDGDLIGLMIDAAFHGIVGGGRSVAGNALATQAFTPAERRPCPVAPSASTESPPMAVATSSKNGKANVFRRSGSGSPTSRGIAA
jgi:hypothetical protein